MLIHTENTPNPDALKFLPNCEVAGSNITHFANRNDAVGKSTLVVKLFNIEGVEAVFLGKDFITITKTAQFPWDFLKPEILMVIMEHLVANHPIFDTHAQANVNTENLSEIEKQIVEIIETRVRPSVAMDGGDIVYKGFKDGVVFLELYGACSGCPSSSITLKNGIESMLKHFVPEVIAVEAVNGINE